MHRRTVLATVGLGVSGLGGCLASDESGPAGDGSRTIAEPSNSHTPTDRSSAAGNTPVFDPGGRVATISVGKRTGEIIPHGVVIWNARESATTVRVRVVDATAGETRHERTHDLPADAALAIGLRAPARYQLTVRILASDRERTISIPDRLFDTCNESYTHVSLRPNGITERTMTTEIACLTPTSHPSPDQ